MADALVKAHLRWNRIGRMEFPSSYVRMMVTNCHLSEKRRWVNRFVCATSTGELPDIVGPAAGRLVDDRDQLDQLLRLLPQQQRAAIVLRYHLDLPDEAIAQELRCSTGAVRSYISRGLHAVRSREAADPAQHRPLLSPPPRNSNAAPSGEHR